MQASQRLKGEGLLAGGVHRRLSASVKKNFWFSWTGGLKSALIITGCIATKKSQSPVGKYIGGIELD